MRLSTFEVESIKLAVSRYAPNAEVYLFGSRTDDAKRGGDIDLLLMNEAAIDLLTVQTISDDIQAAIGEQKIDIVSATPDSEDAFVQYVISKAPVRL